MKKYLIALFQITIMMTLTSSLTYAVNSGIPQGCEKKLDAVARELEHKSFQEISKNKAMWNKFKKDARQKGKWDEIVHACCPSCTPSHKVCTACKCDGSPCTWKCL